MQKIDIMTISAKQEDKQKDCCYHPEPTHPSSTPGKVPNQQGPMTTHQVCDYLNMKLQQ